LYVKVATAVEEPMPESGYELTTQQSLIRMGAALSGGPAKEG